MKHERYASRRALLAASALTFSAALASGATVAAGATAGNAARPAVVQRSGAAATRSADPTVVPHRLVTPAASGQSIPATGPATFNQGSPRIGPRAALHRLLAGNQRFTAGQSMHPRQDPDTLRRLARGQRPFAVVIGCADSRVPPEVLFDQGLGDLFGNRLAGNVVDGLILASVEYAVRNFASPLVVVLGHERCGAITATVDAIKAERVDAQPGNTIVEALRPIVAPALALPGDPVENAMRANVQAQVRHLRNGSALISGRAARDDLLVVGARYDLDDGRVTLLP